VDVDDTGASLVAHRDEMDRGEAVWLQALARFDLDQGWYDDGQLSCAEWLILHTKMARATAFEKLRVARQLHRRPLIADAFAQDRLSWAMGGPDRSGQRVFDMRASPHPAPSRLPSQAQPQPHPHLLPTRRHPHRLHEPHPTTSARDDVSPRAVTIDVWPVSSMRLSAGVVIVKQPRVRPAAFGLNG
jgi:hypothetical protein